MTTGSGSRVLYMPNESGDLGQRGPRRALGGLLDAGLIEDVRIVSLLHRVRVGDGQAERARVLQLVKDFEPTIVLLDKPSGTGLKRRDFCAWRKLAEFKFVLNELDPYHWWFKPISRESRAAGPFADVAYVPGSGSFIRLLRRAGARDVRWVPQAYDPGRFGLTPITDKTIKADVVMIGGRITSKYAPLRGIPGAPARRDAVAALDAAFGERFHIYGNDWAVRGAMGPLPFEAQERAIRTAWVSANWDHFAYEPDYYSNRLPISLASGTVHFTTRHAGFERQFGELPFLRFVDRPEDLAPSIREYLAGTLPAERLEHARQARAYAEAHHRQDEQVAVMLNAAGAAIDLDVARDVFRRGTRMLTEE